MLVVVMFALFQDSFIIETGVRSLKSPAWDLLAGPSSWDSVVEWLITIDRSLFWNVFRSLSNKRFLLKDGIIIKTSVWSLESPSWDLLTGP